MPGQDRAEDGALGAAGELVLRTGGRCVGAGTGDVEAARTGAWLDRSA